MPTGRTEVRIPGDLPVVMGVDIDPAWSDQQPGSVDFALGGASLAPNRRDGSRVDRDVAGERRFPAAVDDFAIADYQVMHKWAPFLKMTA